MIFLAETDIEGLSYSFFCIFHCLKYILQITNLFLLVDSFLWLQSVLAADLRNHKHHRSDVNKELYILTTKTELRNLIILYIIIQLPYAKSRIVSRLHQKHSINVYQAKHKQTSNYMIW